MSKLYEVAPFVVAYSHKTEENAFGLLENFNEHGKPQPMIFRTQEEAQEIADSANKDYPDYDHEVCRFCPVGDLKATGSEPVN